MKLTNLQIQSAAFVLQNLDAPQDKRRFQFADKVNYAIARNMKRLKEPLLKIQDAREALKTAYDPDGKTGAVVGVGQDGRPVNKTLIHVAMEAHLDAAGIAAATSKQEEWDKKHEELMAEEVEFEPYAFPFSGLQVAKNPDLPQQLIAEILDVFITDDFANEPAEQPPNVTKMVA